MAASFKFIPYTGPPPKTSQLQRLRETTIDSPRTMYQFCESTSLQGEIYRGNVDAGDSDIACSRTCTTSSGTQENLWTILDSGSDDESLPSLEELLSPTTPSNTAAKAEREPLPCSLQDPAQGDCLDLPERADNGTRSGSSATLIPAAKPVTSEKILEAADNSLPATEDEIACPHLQAASSSELVDMAMSTSGEHSRQGAYTPSQCTDINALIAQDEPGHEEILDRGLLRSHANDERNQEKDVCRAQDAYRDTETSDREGKSSYNDEYIDLHNSGEKIVQGDTTEESEFEDDQSSDVDKSITYEVSEREGKAGCPILNTGKQRSVRYRSSMATFANSTEAARPRRSLLLCPTHSLADSPERRARIALKRQPIQGFVEHVNGSSAKFRITFDIDRLPSMFASSQYATQLPSPQSDASLKGESHGQKRVRYTEEDDEALLRLRDRQKLSFNEI